MSWTYSSHHQIKVPLWKQGSHFGPCTRRRGWVTAQSIKSPQPWIKNWKVHEESPFPLGSSDSILQFSKTIVTSVRWMRRQWPWPPERRVWSFYLYGSKMNEIIITTSLIISKIVMAKPELSAVNAPVTTFSGPFWPFSFATYLEEVAEPCRNGIFEPSRSPSRQLRHIMSC